MTVTAAAVTTWAGDVQSALAALPQELDQAAPSGAFASVLAQASALLREGPGAVAASATSTGAGTGAGAGASAAYASLTSFTSLTSLASPTSLTSLTSIATPTTLAAIAGGAGSASAVSGQDVVAEAAKYLATPYVWGGDTPSEGFDCSGLVQYVYGQLGVQLPRTSQEQALVGTAVPSLTQAVPGDLVFFAGSDGTPTSPGHVGIYVGGGKMIDAPYTGTDVQVQTVEVAGPVVAIRSVLPSAAGASGSAVTKSSTYASVLSGASALPAGASATPTSTGPVAVPTSLAPIFVGASAKYGVSAILLAAVARQESGFTTHAVSTAGAEGMMQIMPETAAGLGITAFTPAQAVDGAAALLSRYIQQYHSIPLALAAYSAGPGAVAEYGGIPPYPQTQDYVTSIMQTLGASQ